MRKIAIAVSLLIWSAAEAAPPPDGTMVSFRHVMIVCNKLDSITELVAAQKVSNEAFDVKSRELLMGESPICTPATVTNVIALESTDLGVVTWGQESEHLWAIKLGGLKKEAFALYEELVNKGSPA